jgi:hypothetical protein
MQKISAFAEKISRFVLCLFGVHDWSPWRYDRATLIDNRFCRRKCGKSEERI